MTPLIKPAALGLTRRTFLERLGVAATGLSLAPWLGACGSDERTRSSARPMPYDPTKAWWLQGNYAPVLDEIERFDLPVRGKLPAELEGLYVRNGSNPQKVDSPHWFFGDGMLHGMRFEGGRVAWYRNRYVKTDLYVAGKGFAEPGTAPTGGNNQSNVSAIYHGGKLLTSGEVGFPYQIDPTDLSTMGVHDFDTKLKTSFTAHPKIDPKTGHLHFFGYWFVPPYLTYHVADASGRVLQSYDIPVNKCTMMHSFAITDQDVIFWELPVLFDLQAAVNGSSNPFGWDASYGARIGIMPLGGPLEALRWVEIDPCYVFHEVNAFRDGSDVLIDVCRHQDMFNGDDLGDKPSTIRRWRVNTAGQALAFSEEIMSDHDYELPTHDRRFTGRRHKHGWFVSTRENADTIEFAGTGHIDFERGKSSQWDPGATRHADETTFVPAGAGEGEGWLLTFVYDHATDSSELVVLNALHVEDGPVASVALPRRVPHGFHGVWVPA
jgi:carotenoid cleavage dioxygenase